MKKFKAPNAVVLLFAIVALVAVATWIVPAGEYERVEVDGKILVDPDSYRAVEGEPQGIDDVLVAPIEGFIEGAEIIGFVLIVGGAFGVLRRTGAVDAGIKTVAEAHRNSKTVRAGLIPILMTIFSLGGAVFGMAEETIPFIFIFVPLALELNYDTITGVAIPYVGAGAGFAGAFLNPFTIGVAQGIAGVPLFSGVEYRLVVWVLITATAISFVSWHAARVRRDPSKSPTRELDATLRAKSDKKEKKATELTKRHKWALLVFALGMVVLTYGVLRHGWFIVEICGVFVALTLVVAVVGGLSVDESVDSFLEGAKDLIATGIVIALAKGALVIARDGGVIDTILHYLAGALDGLHPILASQAMIFTESIVNLFVPSGSGQAALTMPVMAPLGDLLEVPRQIVVLAFQFGDGFTNLIIPTSAVTMGVLTAANVPWEKWARWILPLEAIFFLLGVLLMIPPFLFGWG